MRLTVHAVAAKMPDWVELGVGDYVRRLPRELRLQWRDVPLARRGRDTQPAALCRREGEALLKGVDAADRVIALDVAGKPWSTENLAQRLRDWQMDGSNVSFLIGGPDGLSSDCLARASGRWSLSRLTLPHTLVRVVLAEQLYRAWSINAGHPYHRA